MQQFLKVWAELERGKQIIIIAATIAMFIGILMMSRMASKPSMTLLYAGLEIGAAGEVIQSLEQQGVVFDVRGGSIFVDSAMRDELRLTLASEGLPANGSRGYELLDQLSGFGTTSQMFDAAYWRAKEGELARTILASPHVALVRVHIASTGSNPFQRGITPKASVFVTPQSDEITAPQAKAIRFLVASAVSGLAAEDVAVIDSNGALVGSSEEVASVIGGDDKAQVLRDRVQRLLEARVGFGNAVVEVSVDTVTESESLRETRIDPDSRVAISTDTEERTGNSTEVGGGDVTVASNLPDQEEGGEGGSGSSQSAETRERINYEVSEVEREVVRNPGAIKRVTVAALINENLVANETGDQIPTPRTPEEIEVLRELISSAVGYDESRGDIITVKSLGFLSVPAAGTLAPTGLFSGQTLDLMSLIKMGILALMTLLLGLLVVRPLLKTNVKSLREEPSQPVLGSVDDLSNLPAIEDTVAQSSENSLILPGPGSGESVQAEILPSLPLMVEVGVAGLENTDPVNRLRTMIGDRQEETVEILRSWLEDGEGEKVL